jgi:lysophospholipase L1-like esterase
MRFFHLSVVLSLIVSSCNTNSNKDNQKMDSLYPKKGTFVKYQEEWAIDGYYKRLSEFKSDPIGDNKIVFLGNSITEGGGDWNKRFGTKNIVNRGIGGDITEGVIVRIKEIIYFKPVAVFLLIGINDIFNSDKPNRDKITESYVANNILKIANIVSKKSPSTKFFVQTILPVNPKSYFKENGFFPEHPVPLPDQINNINKILKENDQLNVIDLHSAFVDAQEYLDIKYSDEGVHLNEAGYSNWANFINDEIASIK